MTIDSQELKQALVNKKIVATATWDDLEKEAKIRRVIITPGIDSQ